MGRQGAAATTAAEVTEVVGGILETATEAEEAATAGGASATATSAKAGGAA